MCGRALKGVRERQSDCAIDDDRTVCTVQACDMIDDMGSSRASALIWQNWMCLACLLKVRQVQAQPLLTPPGTLCLRVRVAYARGQLRVQKNGMNIRYIRSDILKIPRLLKNNANIAYSLLKDEGAGGGRIGQPSLVLHLDTVTQLLHQNRLPGVGLHQRDLLQLYGELLNLSPFQPAGYL